MIHYSKYRTLLSRDESEHSLIFAEVRKNRVGQVQQQCKCAEVGKPHQEHVANPSQEESNGVHGQLGQTPQSVWQAVLVILCSGDFTW
jgi:hypothetical protein